MFLSLLMAAELCVAGFKYPGFLRQKGGGSGPFGITSGGKNNDETAGDGFAAELLAYFGMTEEDYREYLKDPVEATPENSPGNPDFLGLSYTQAEYDAAETMTSPVSRDNPTADFPEFGIHADLKWWNLENETDTLVVKRMPAKTEDGAQYYTYDYSLASGQSAFPTNVEITVPIQSPGGAPGNVLTTDPETGRWKEVYYILSGDGKTYTLFMDHFTAGTEESDREITLEDGTRIAANFTYENGKSIFDYVFREGAPKYENTSHYLYNVGVIRTPDLEKFLSHDSRRAVQILNGLVTKSGGVPAEAGLSESSSCFGETVDDMSFNSTVLSLFPLAKDLSDVNSGGGLVLSVLGIEILALRLSDQLSRGVGWDKIGSSNAWGFASAAVGVLGLPFFGLPMVGIALAGCGIYVCSKIGAAQSKEEREKRILQNPRTIEEGAYDCFLYEYTRQIPEYVVLNDPAYEGVRGNERAKADFTGVVMKADPNSCTNGSSLVNIPSSRRNIKDIKVPILPETKEEAETWSLAGIDDHGGSAFALDQSGAIMESIFRDTKLRMEKDGTFAASGSGSGSTSIPVNSVSSAIPLGDEEFDPDPVEWTEMNGSRSLSFELSGKYDAKTEKGTAVIRGSASGADTYTDGHASGDTTSNTISGDSSFSGSAASVWKDRSRGRETLHISFFMHDENGEQVYDLYSTSTENGSVEAVKAGWWLELEFVKDD